MKMKNDNENKTNVYTILCVFFSNFERLSPTSDPFFFSSHIIHLIFIFSLRSLFFTYIEFVLGKKLLKYQDKRRRKL